MRVLSTLKWERNFWQCARWAFCGDNYRLLLFEAVSCYCKGKHGRVKLVAQEALPGSLAERLLSPGGVESRLHNHSDAFNGLCGVFVCRGTFSGGS